MSAEFVPATVSSVRQRGFQQALLSSLSLVSHFSMKSRILESQSGIALDVDDANEMCIINKIVTSFCVAPTQLLIENLLYNKLSHA